MNKKEKKQYEDLFHIWSEWIYSADITKISDKALKEFEISEKEHQEAVKASVCRLKQGILLVNEAIPDWELVKDLLLGLDRFPHVLLQDIHAMEGFRYKGVKPTFYGITDISEKLRRLLYFVYIPELILVHKTSKYQHI